MLAAYAARLAPDAPLTALEVAERPEPTVPDGWTTVRLKAASLNHHDLWSLKGVGLAEDKLPMILGTDGAGIDADGNEVVIHSVIADPANAPGGDETLDPRRSLLSEVHDGTLAEIVAVPRRNLVPKPADLSFAEAACLPTAWLTAYRMLFTKSGLRPGQTVLVQGAGGGVATAAIALARAAGFRVWVTSRDEAKRASALSLGAHEAFESGARLPGKVDAVIETVGRGHLEPLAALAAPRRDARRLRRHHRAEPEGRPEPGVLPPAQRGRLHDGHARRAGGDAADDGEHRAATGDRRAAAAGPRRRRDRPDRRRRRGGQDRPDDVTPLRVAVVAGPAPGHLFPAVGLARALLRAGHAVRVVTGLEWLSRLTAAGLDGAPLPRLPPGMPADDLGWRLVELPALMAPELAPDLAAWGADVVVTDLLTVAGGWAAELLGLPWVKLVPGCLQDPSRHLPPYGSGLQPARSPLGRGRDRWLNRMSAPSVTLGRRDTARVRGGIGLPPVPLPAAQLVATLPALEVPRADWPARSPLVGPLWWDPAVTDLPLPPGDAPLVVVAGSTAGVTSTDLLALALAGLTGVRVAATALEPLGGAVPPWARVGQGRQGPLLAEAVRTGGCVLTHGGHGMMAKALAHGLPVVSVPGQGDQAGNASRLRRAGAGLVLAERGLTADSVAAAVRRVLAEPGYRRAAERAAAGLRALGPDRAVQVVERVARGLGAETVG